MQIDVTKTGLENILLLANTTNGATVAATDVEISAVTVFAGEEGNTRNTQVTFSAKEGSTAYKGSQVLRYTRHTLADIAAIRTVGEFQSTEASTLDDVKAFVVGKLGIAASEVDIVEAEFPTWDDGTIDGETAQLTLRVKVGSYLYLGDLAVTVVEPADGRERFSTVFAKQDLDGFDLPAAGE